MFRTTGSVLALFMILSAGGRAWSYPADEPREMLAQAVALYYEADFAKSIELLLRADELLRQQSGTGTVQDKIDVKLQLALGFIGLNDSTKAKTYLEELYALDLDHHIDPQTFSPKVIQLADEAKAGQKELRCRSVTDQAQRQLEAGHSEAVVNLIRSGEAKCPTLASLYPKAGELFFKDGLEAYRKARMEEALRKFREALRLEPKHELAAQYLDLTESKLEIAVDRAFLAWRKDFTAGDYVLAARDYKELLSLSRPETIEEIQMEYRRALSKLVDLWIQACAKDDAATMDELRERFNTMLPEPSFANDILAKMTTCKPTGCIQMATPLVLTRLKSRIDPEFTAAELVQLKAAPLTVRVKARINEKGDVAASEVTDGNPMINRAIRAAFDQWKFAPTVVQGEPRCVDTEVPIVINFSAR
jgi:tetratricopeptide (TPR) repeat protein